MASFIQRLHTRVKNFAVLTFENVNTATLFDGRRELIPQYCTMIMQTALKNSFMYCWGVDISEITSPGIMRVKVGLQSYTG